MYHLIKAYCHQGQQKIDVKYAPSIIEVLLDKYIVFNKKLDIIFESDMGYRHLYRNHLNLLDSNVITVGGDHSIALSTVSSSLKKYGDELFVIWIDAHADINTYESSISKNTHGMPVSSLIGLQKNIFSVPRLKNLIYLGVRDIDQPEKEFIEKLNIPIFSNSKELISYLRRYKINKVHISFDVDALDPSLISSTGTRASNGLTMTDVIETYNYLNNNAIIVGFDIVELNPSIGNLDKSLKCLNFILSNLFSQEN